MTRHRPTLGVLTITHNEEANIARCLQSVAFADQIVVVDSGSDDRTVEIASALGADVRTQPWLGYSAQKQLALGYLTTDWVLWIDADEEIPPALRDEILAVIRSEPRENGFRLPRMVRYLGRWIRHGGWYPDPKLRLFRRGSGRFDGKLVHEGVAVVGKIGKLTSPFFHYPYRDHHHHAEKVERYARLAAEQMRAEGRVPTWLDLLLRPPIRFVRMALLRRGFLDGRPGWMAAWMEARYVWLKYFYARGGRAGGKA